MKKIKASRHFNGHKFINLKPIRIKTGDQSTPAMFKEFFFGNGQERYPLKPLPAIQLDKMRFNSVENQLLLFAWLGHSTIVMSIGGKVIVTDPVFNRASPVSFAGPKPFLHQYRNSADNLPDRIDIVLISHDHYDHLDYATIRKIDSKVGRYLVPLGVKAHLSRWGISEHKINEMDWYENDRLNDQITFTFAPAQHFSGRGLNDRFKTLWGGWIIKTDKHAVFYSGDSAYFSEFAAIGRNYGPFDIAFLECGAYNKGWAGVHMFPEETVQAAIDLQSKVLMPVHNGKYDLSLHSWQEPLHRVWNSSREKGVTLVTPLIGEVFDPEKDLPQSTWWQE